MRKHLLGAGLFAIAVSLAAPAAALDLARQQDYRTALAALTAMIEGGAAAPSEIFAKAAFFGLGFDAPTLEAGPAAAAAISPAAPDLSLVSIDLILSQLALQTGANYHVALRQAQQRPQVLILETGTVDLAGLYEAVTAAGLEGVLTRTDGGIVAHVPIAVWTGATLALQAGETLALDRSTGAFLIVAGQLASAGARIEASGAANSRLEGFAPFVVVALGGVAAIDDTDFAGLGFTAAAPMTGITLVGGGLHPAPQHSFIRNSRFTDSGTLALLGATGATVENNLFSGAPGPAVLVSGSSGASIRRNVIAGTRASHGIKLTAGAAGAVVSGNIIVDNGANGIFADSGVLDLTVSGNLIGANTLSGISLASADCVAVAGNLLLRNGQSGLAIRDSAGAAISANRFLDNKGAGIAVSRQPAHGHISVADNRNEGNKVGVNGSTTGRLDFAGNDFSGQTPRLLDGELVQFAARFFAVSASGGPLTIEGLDGVTAARPQPAAAERSQSCKYPEGV